MKATIALLPGDGIGPEVTAAAREILSAVAARFGHQFRFEEADIGGVALDRHGDPLPLPTFELARNADAVFLGAVGGPQWEDPRARRRPEQGLLNLRAGLQVYANLRPIKVMPVLADLSPLKREYIEGVDFIIVRELTGGIYFSAPKFREVLSDGSARAIDTLEYSDNEVRRIAKVAFKLAQQRSLKVTSVDKSNVLETSRLWRHAIDQVAPLFPGIVLEHRLIDSAAMRLVVQASTFDVLVTENMFGDILSDEAAILTGSIGLLPSASLGDDTPGLFEPIHGSAPDIAGQGIANPIGAIASAALLCRHGLNLEEEAHAIESAIESALRAGLRTFDLGGRSTTSEMTRAIRDALL